MRPTDPRLLRQLAPARGRLVGVLAGSAAGGLLVIAQAWAVAALVVAVVRHQPLGPAVGFVAAVFALRALAGWLTDTLATRAASEVGNGLRRRILGAVLRHVGDGTPPASSGTVAVLATRGVAAAEPWFTRYLPAVAVAGVLPPLTVVAIATQDLLSAVIVLATLPLVPVFGALVGLATRDRAEQQWRAMSSLSGHFVDVMRGLPTLVVHRRARAQSRTIEAATHRYREATLRTLRLAFLSSAVLETVATISVALVAVVVGTRLATGGLDLHTALVVLLLAPEAYWPLRRVGAEFHAAAEGVATFEAVDALDSPADAEAEGPPATPPAADALLVSGLTVRHPGREVPALHRLDARIPARGVTVVTGPSGCGKTTLLSVLAGQLPPAEGSLTLGGAPVGGAAWRRQVAWLPQRPVFVAGTVADNLLLAVPAATEEQLWRALRRVALEERVRDLPGGLATDLSEDGANLSAGERARLALARVVLADRPWVLLDEPTAHLDDLTSQVILDTVQELGRDHAVVMVAHRDGAVEVADTVLPLTAPAPSPAVARAAPPAAALPTAPVTATAPARSGMGLSTLLGSLASASGVALTATAGWLIVQASARPAVLTLMVAIVGVRTFGLARPVLRYAERLRSHDVALRLLAGRRVQVYEALVPLVPGRLGRRRGDVLASIVDDVDGVVDEHLRVRLPVRSFALVATLATVVAALVLPVAAVAVGTTTFLAGVLALGLARAGAGRAEARAVEHRADLSAEVVEVVQTATELVRWQGEAGAVERVAAAGDRMGRDLVTGSRWTASGRAVALVAAGLGVVATAALTAPYVGAGVSAPMAALLVLLPLALTDLTLPLAEAGALSARTSAAARRLRELETTGPLVEETARRPLPADPGFDLLDVGGGYDPQAPVLDGLTLSLPAGARLGVVGRSGSGKSTLAGLLLRFLDPTTGHVLLGGTPTHWLGLDDLRRVVGLVDDDPHVFATTLRENLRLARPGATDDEVVDALRQAALGDWLEALPEGLDTWLGDGHAQVSGGERARLAIARSLLSGQRVVVLDEPVAHLDHATAEQIAAEVLGSARSRSIVWITHAAVGLDRVDRVLDLDALGVPVRAAT